MFKKIFSFFAALTLSVGLWAETVSYRYPMYNDGGATKGIKEWKTTTADATPITSTSSTWGTAGQTTWFVVNENVTISQRITCKGDVRLILADGAKLTAQQGITVSGSSNSLTIYAQSTGSQMGQLIATGGSDAAGIGGTLDQPGNNITINGGVITASASNSSNAAGIGGGSGSFGSNITINGGVVTANGANNGGAGIGAGYCPMNGTTTNIIINGGEVKTTGGIGVGGGNSDGEPVSGIYINGGKVTATGGYYGGAIGGCGFYNLGSNIFVATSLVIKADGNNPPTTVIENTGADLANSLFGKLYATIDDPRFVLPDKTAGQYATICLPRPIAGVTNATLYKISYGNIYEVHFVEETNFTADPAGTPYLVQATTDGDIVFTMADAEPVTAPVSVTDAKGFVASLQEELQDVPEGENYLLVSGGELHSAGANCHLSKNHAYIDINYVPASAPAPQGAPRRVVLYNADAQTPTDLETMHNTQCTMHNARWQVHHQRSVCDCERRQDLQCLRHVIYKFTNLQIYKLCKSI